MCNCIDEMNAKLAEHNTELALTFGFSRSGGGSETYPTIQTKKLETRKRVGPALAIPSYCPFCGESYIAAVETLKGAA
jgi:hypothetical protein